MSSSVSAVPLLSRLPSVFSTTAEAQVSIFGVSLCISARRHSTA